MLDKNYKINSHYKYILWTDETMEKWVKKEYPDFYTKYKSYKYNIQRCDAHLACIP